jgi:hypothetical protein
MKAYTAIVFALCSLMIGVAGCASQGNRTIAGENQYNVEAKIEVGKTTKEDVRAAYGSPISANFTDSGNEIWRYTFARTKMTGKSFIPIYGIFAGGMRGNVKELVVFFGTDNVVKNFTFTDSPVEGRYGVGY